MAKQEKFSPAAGVTTIEQQLKDPPINLYRKRLQKVIFDELKIKVPLVDAKPLMDALIDTTIDFILQEQGQYVNLGTSKEKKLSLRFKQEKAVVRMNLQNHYATAFSSRTSISVPKVANPTAMKSIGMSPEEFEKNFPDKEFEFTPITDAKILKEFGMDAVENAEAWDIIKMQIELQDEED